MTRTRVGLVEAARDPALLGAVPWHPRQLDLFALIERFGTTIADAGRRGGKSRISAGVSLWQLLLRPELDRFLPPYETRLALAVANSEEQARILLEHAAAIVRSSPVLRGELVAERESELEFRGGRVLRVLPCSARTARGLGAAIVVLDEFGHFLTTDEGPRAAARVWAAVRPAIAAFGKEGKVLVVSTPGDDGGLFEQLYAKAEAGELENAAAFTATTQELNPAIDAAFLRGEELALGPDTFAREYLGRFVAGGGRFFDPDELRACVGNHREALPEDGRSWVCSIDPSSGGGDPFACVTIGRDARPGFAGRLIVGHVERWLPRRSRVPLSRRTRSERDLWVDSVLDGVAAIAKRFRALVVSDQHVPGVVVDELRQRGVMHVRVNPWTPQTKTEAFQALRARVSTSRISLANDDQLAGELARVRTRYRSGFAAVEVSRAGGGHSDLAVALAAGVLELDRYGVVTPTNWRRQSAEPAVVSLDVLERIAPSGEPRRRTRRWYADRGGPGDLMSREW